ncbi:hypothetical protein HMN09_01057000 [Mycena chlorophos]|uniref:L domain-like protein n=1 Tax=Mycena chlorophos TaxID=658473 RepID=A0A8H6SDX0_MYCCL|nr:hypothetical protein HMN09_01057000 [Mycena chlorophos]
MPDDEADNRPAWQTDELQDEWPDTDQDDNDDDADNDDNLTSGTRSVSLTEPLPSHIHTSTDSPAPFQSVGTFLVREDIPAAPVLPKTPGRNGRSGIIKDFFSPLPLERMFEPPTPPLPSMPMPPVAEASDEIVETDLPDMVSFHGRKASLDCKFTFSAPRQPSGKPGLPQATSTPTPPFAPNHTQAAPTTDPRLRLFQFQYDTFTREHLSALADSIAVNTPSGTATATRSDARLSPVSEAPSFSDLRSTKRVKLSPASDYGEGAGENATVARPKIYGKAYVGESQSLMEKIKQARDFSTISTVASANQSPNGGGDGSDKSSAYEQLRRSSLLNLPSSTATTASSSGGTLNSNAGAPYSSSTYRLQAATLMAQIKSDMKGNKRIFSGDSEMSHVTAHLDDEMSFAHVAPPIIAIQDHDKENLRETSRHHRRVSSGSARIRASPRRPQRTLEPVRENTGELSMISAARRRQAAFIPPQPVTIIANPALLSLPVPAPAPMPIPISAPAHPSGNARATNEDLNRFVSSSTASGTTLTAGSYVKHPGPAQLRTIAPGDVPVLPERMGDMLFDKVMMKWVRNVQAEAGREEVSEDPFGDIESLRDESQSQARLRRSVEREPSDAPTEDEEEVALTSFSTDASGGVVAVMTGIETMTMDDGDITTDSEAAHDGNGDLDLLAGEYQSASESEQEHEPSPSPPPHQEQQQLHVPGLEEESVTGRFLPPPIVVTTFTTPPPSVTKTPAKSALKTPGPSAPSSALRDTAESSSRARYKTPKRAHRRSVSFSDGKRDGPIRGLDATNGSSAQPSARTKRIVDMFAQADESDDLESDTPTKAAPIARSRAHDPEPVVESEGSFASISGNGNTSVSVASTSTPRRVFSRTNAQRNGNNNTFLTECSFAVTHDRLVEVLTDVEPFEPHWENLATVDLAERRLESVARLKEFVPALDALNLNGNQLAWLSGIPSGVRTLSVASNRLTGVTSYSHLLNLENLDISRNEVDSLRQLSCLRHLRELRADGNQVSDLDGLEALDGLVKLSLADNALREVDIARCRWTRLEVLDLSANRLRSVSGLSKLQALVVLNLDDNELGELDVGGSMSRLRVLRVSGNRLTALRVEWLGGLRTLYVDGNALAGDELYGGGRATAGTVGRTAGREGRVGGPLGHLENLSIRSQRGGALRLDVGAVRDAKRLYLSGNALPAGFLSTPCYNLVYLEVARCGLTKLPAGLATLIPNLRALNLNYNFLEDVGGLVGLTRLRKLSVVGARLKATKDIIRVVRGLPAVEALDFSLPLYEFRMNPCTLGWYLPLIVEGDKKTDTSSAGWAELDGRFRKSLPDSVYVGRLAYRGLVMGACSGLRVLDGVGVTEKERAKSQVVLGLM